MMTSDDRKYFDSKFGFVNQRIDTLADDMDMVKRGVYGDEKNKVLGLIQTDKLQHERIKSLEDTRKKVYWFGSGLIVLLEGGWHSIKEFFTKG